MAHDRAKRFPKLITQTPPKIGPGTYELSELPQPKPYLADFYPFLSGTKRKTTKISKDAELFPGPGSYNVKEPRRRILERVSIDFTDARFKEKIAEGPGPVYDLAKDLLKSRKITTSNSNEGPVGKLWLTQPPRSIIPNPTSIPDKFYTGYSVDEYGNFVKNPPIQHEPAFLYDVPREETNTTTILYKGNFWSRMSGRTEPRVFLTPGPGDYEHETKKSAAQIQNEKLKEERRLTCRQSRYLDVMYRRKARENFPAPNCYKIKGTFDRFMKINCKCDPYALEPPPFGQTAKRFGKSESDVPSPDTYDPPVSIKCVGSIYPAPFGVCASRLQKGPDDTGPGPSDYNLVVGNLAYESAKRFKYSHGGQPYSGVSFDTIFLYDDEDDYDDRRSPEKFEPKKTSVYHAAFKSTKSRFPKPKMDVPDPGAYEVLTAFKINRNKCDFLCSRIAPAFGTRSSRVPKQFFGPIPNTPDPTAYELAGDISRNVKGGVISTTKFRQDMSAAPPPSRYCIHPYHLSSVTKKSFNSVLGKPELIRTLEELEKAPPRSRCPRERKKLRWFAVSLRENKRCRPISF